MTKNLKTTAEKSATYLFCAFMKEVQTTGDAFSPLKKYPALKNIKFLSFFSLCGSYLLS
jgi:hypothetical protein